MLLADSLILAQDTLTAIKPLVNNSSSNVMDSLVFSEQTLKAVINAAKDEPSWTDRTQAYAAVVGTIGAVIAAGLGIWSFILTLREQNKKLNDQQSQINNLATIAFNLDKQRRDAKERHLSQIRPNLQIKGEELSSKGEIYIENLGRTASNISLEFPKDISHIENIEGLEISIHRITGYIKEGTSSLKPNEIISVGLFFDGLTSIEHRDLNDSKPLIYKFKILYTDNDTNFYFQEISIRLDDTLSWLCYVKITPPSLVNPYTEEQLITSPQ